MRLRNQEHYGAESLRPLVELMTEQQPRARPTAVEALEWFYSIREGLTDRNTSRRDICTFREPEFTVIRVVRDATYSFHDHLWIHRFRKVLPPLVLDPPFDHPRLCSTKYITRCLKQEVAQAPWWRAIQLKRAKGLRFAVGFAGRGWTKASPDLVTLDATKSQPCTTDMIELPDLSSILGLSETELR